MIETAPAFPEKDVPVESFVKPDIPEAIYEALYGDGVAVVTHLEVPDDVRMQLLEHIMSAEEPTVFEAGWNKDIEYYADFEPDDIMAILEPILNGIAAYQDRLGRAEQDFAAVNLQINSYKPGVNLGPHLDFEYTHTATDGEYDPVESLTIIYVMSGTKDLMVWPHALGKDRQSPKIVKQQPDMLLVMRGGSFEHNDQVYPALWHGVPETSSPSTILTFDVMPTHKLHTDDDFALDLA